MLITNYPNYKDPSQQFEFQNGSKKKKKVISVRKKTAPKYTQRPTRDQTRQNFYKQQQIQQERQQQQMSKTEGHGMYKPPGTSGTYQESIQQQQYTENDSLYWNYYDQDENVRSKQIEQEWEKILEERQQQERQEQAKIQQEKEYYQLREELISLRRYKTWSEQVYANGENNKEYRQIKEKLEQMQAEEEDFNSAAQKSDETIQALQRENQELESVLKEQQENLNKVEKEKKDITQKTNEAQQQTNKNKQQCSKVSQKLQNISSKTKDYFQRKNNKGKIQKTELEQLLTQSQQDITSTGQSIN